MKIFINNEGKDCKSGISLEEIIVEMALSSTMGIAVAVNEVVVPKNKWSDYELKENDKILLIRAAQGG